MKNNIKYGVSFALGAALGALGGYKLFEYKLKKMLLQMKEDEEKQTLQEIANENDDMEEPSIIDGSSIQTGIMPEEKINYHRIITKEKYVPDPEPEVEKGNESDSDIDIIPAQDFDVIPGFDAAYWTLYDDGVMVDDNTGNIVESSMEYIGEEAYNAILSGEDTVCVRNFTTKTDYHIDGIRNAYYDDSRLQPDETID